MSQKQSPVWPRVALVGAWDLTVPAFHRTRPRAPAGFLFHWIREGAYCLVVDGTPHELTPGDWVWYDGSERLEFVGGETPVSFLSVLLHAPDLPPLDRARRRARGPARVRRAMETAVALWGEGSSLLWRLRVQAALGPLLTWVWAEAAGTTAGDGPWARAETHVLSTRRFRMPIRALCEAAAASPATLTRDCRRRHGVSPQQRLRALRMNEACGLLKHSTLTVGAVAHHLGYPRIHEFSREFARQLGRSPTAYRRDPNAHLHATR